MSRRTWEREAGVVWWFDGLRACEVVGGWVGGGMLVVYTYQGCSTCRKAIWWLKAYEIEFGERPIRETPPTLAELRVMVEAQGGGVRRLFNTSGLDYRSMGLKDRLPGMEVEEALVLLAERGNLVKRPFAIDLEAGVALVGFDEGEWKRALVS